MSEQTENTQPTQPINQDDTQPIKPIRKKSRRWLSILIGILGFILLIGLGGSADSIRNWHSQSGAKFYPFKTTPEQYSFALVDIEFKRYEAAAQRLEYHHFKTTPATPAHNEKLTEVLVLSVIPTPTPRPHSHPHLISAAQKAPTSAHNNSFRRRIGAVH